MVIAVSAGAGTSEGCAEVVFGSSPQSPAPSQLHLQPPACTNTLLCSLPRIDKTMLASLKIK